MVYLSVYAAAVLAKMFGIPVMKNVPWGYFILLPLFVIIVRGVGKLLLWAFCIAWFLFAMDFLVWLGCKVFSDGSYHMVTMSWL